MMELHKISRRSFLEATALSGAAAALASTTAGCSPMYVMGAW